MAKMTIYEAAKNNLLAKFDSSKFQGLKNYYIRCFPETNR